ncbi:MAG: hypothetical protein KBT03_07035 [Bacteroidales bacterium]|nr:hypothetical protein [Candidatus Scybalousia scybalohippi]
MATQRKRKTVVVPPKEIGTANSKRYDQYSVYNRVDPKELEFPHSVYTYDEMSNNVTIASATTAVDIIALRVPRYITPYDDSETHKQRAKFLDECLGITKDANDMTHSFDDFLREALSMNKYGFSIHEKVFRLRRKKYGSKFDDGKVGIKRLPIRPQYSIEEFVYSDDGRDLLGVKQALNTKNMSTASIAKLINNTLAMIPRDRFMLFNAGVSTGKAEGVSPLRGVYYAWRELLRYKDLENIASSKNLNGLPVLYMPAESMIDDPDDPDSAVFRTLRDGISKISVGQQTSLLLPSDRESDSGAGGKLYDFQLMSASSSNITAISATIKRLTDEILQCLFADILQSDGNADDTKTTMMNMYVENRIKEIFTKINTDLIPDLWERNGWDVTKLPQIEYGTLKEVSMSDFAKAVQQTKAVKFLPPTPKNVNYVLEKLGFPDRVSNTATPDEMNKILGVEEKDDSRAGDGLAKGSGNGTSDKVSETDNATSNLDNK